MIRTHWVAALSAILLFAGDAASAVVGEPAPEFSATDENGKSHRLADYRGKIVVLEWTNYDCPFVVRHYESDTMERLSKKHGGDGVVWLAVNSTHYNKPEDTRAFKQSEGFTYATLQDSSGELGKLYKAKTTPQMFLIDAEGQLRYSGAIDDSPWGRKRAPKNYVDGGLSALAAGAAPTPSETKPYGCSVKYSD